MTKRPGNRKPAAPVAAEPPPATEVSIPSHPRLLAVSAVAYAAWLVFLGYVAWRVMN